MGEGQKLIAEFDGFSLLADQPESNGGENSAPGPYDIFLASIGLCGTYYLRAFCSKREISTEGLESKLIASKDEKGKLSIEIELILPESFPEKYKKAALAALRGCSVRKSLELGVSITETIKS